MGERIGRHADFMTIQVEVDIHEESLHEGSMDVNFSAWMDEAYTRTQEQVTAYAL
jgi:hypothetical protein